MATRPQIAMIHTLKSKIKLPDDQYRALLEGFGVESSKHLSTLGAKELIERLMSMVRGGVQSPPPPRVVSTSEADAILSGKVRYANSNEAATFAQQAKIRHLWNQVSRVPEADRECALQNWLRRRFNIWHMNWLPRNRVGAVIHALSAMIKQAGEKEGVPGGV